MYPGMIGVRTQSNHLGCKSWETWKWLHGCISQSCFLRQPPCYESLSSPDSLSLVLRLIVGSGNIKAASPLNLELLLKAPLLLTEALLHFQAAAFVIKATAECVSAAIFRPQWTDAHVSGWDAAAQLKQLADPSIMGREQSAAVLAGNLTS